MRVATTKFGSKLHVIDPNTDTGKDTRTTCGVSHIVWVVVKKPVRGQVCQNCVRISIARMKRILDLKPTKPTIKGEKGRRGSPSQIEPDSLQAQGPRFVED